MEETKVTDEQILEEAREIFSANPQMRKCKACAYADEDCSRCSKLNKPLTKRMYAGMCKFYETHEERIIRETREALKIQEKEERKVNHLLTMCLNCLEASMLFLEDFANRVETEYKRAEMRGTGNPKVRQNDRNWIGNLKRANKAMSNNIEGARRQYQHFVMPILNKVFYDKDTNKYDVEMFDDYLSDATELAHLVLRYFDVAFMNEANAQKVIGLMKTMDSCGVMEEKDFNHYNFRR